MRSWWPAWPASSAALTRFPPGPRDVLTAAERAALASEPAGGDVLVAVVDGGVDTAHPALRDRVVRTWRAPGLTAERGTHGTQVAGVLAGSATAAWSGGLAPDARLLDVQVLDRDGHGSADDLAAGLRFARTAEADLVLTSLALGWDASAVRAAVEALVRDGVLVVASSGNGFDDLPVFPAAYPGVLGVAALDRDGRRLALSAWAGADVAAPGDAVLAPVPGGGYAPVTGTSAAAAVAAGLLAACGGADHPAAAAPAPPWTSGSVEDAGRARPRLTCPGHHDEGGR
ncbi:hypothetical protein GCM10009714_17760 [Microlunatus capsulatus]